MKKLSLYAVIVSVLITMMYTIKVLFLIETDAEFYRETALALVGNIGLYVAYVILRDYEIVRSREEQMLEFMGKFKSK